MKRNLLIAVIVGMTLIAAAKEPETIDQLKARATAADRNKQPELFLRLAKMQLEAANDTYNSSPEQARKLVGDAAESAEKGGQASIDSHKREKKTEIELRELGKRMDDVGRSWAFDDRAPVKTAMQRVETIRSKLLDRMFEK